MQEFNDSNNLITNLEQPSDEIFLDSFLKMKEAFFCEIAKFKEELFKNDGEEETLVEKNHQAVIKILDDLEKSIAKFDEQHNSEAEEKKAMHSRNLVLRLKKGQIDKVISEAKDSINKLQKTASSSIEANENEIKKLEKEFSSKINEAERQAKNEVKKISDEILNPIFKDEEDIDFISVSEDVLEEKFLKDEAMIKEMRIEGVNNIANIKYDFYNLKHENELSFYNSKLSLEKEIEITKNKEDEELANLKHIVNEESNRLKDEEYTSQLSATLNIHTNNYKNSADKVELVTKEIKKVYNIYANLDLSNNEKLNKQISFLSKIKEIELKIIEDCFNDFRNLDFDKIFKNEKIMIDNYILNDYHDDNLSGYDFNNHLQALKKIAESFNNENINDELDNQKKKFIEEIENNYLSAKEYLEKYSEEENQKVKDSFDEKIDYCLGKIDEVTSILEKFKAIYLKAVDDYENEKEAFRVKCQERDLNEINQFKVNMKVIKQQPALINKKYDKLFKEQSYRIEQDYQKAMEHVKQERSEKLKVWLNQTL